MKKALLLGILLIGYLANAQDLKPYQIYTAKGKKTTFKKMQKQLAKADVILFGELHNNAIAHWLQYEMTLNLSEKRTLMLGAEMFETDNQEALSEYVEGSIDAEGLDSTARLWKNFTTDYKPLVDIAKENKYTFVASNVPRRYASTVYKGGFEALDTLPKEDLQWLPPLPITYDPEVACYKNILAMSHGHGGTNLPKAQALKDATMAYNILKHYQEGLLFIHYNGSYHSDNYEGILWYLKLAQPEANYKTITTKTQADVSKLSEENKGTADFIIVVDENMTNTY